MESPIAPPPAPAGEPTPAWAEPPRRPTLKPLPRTSVGLTLLLVMAALGWILSGNMDWLAGGSKGDVVTEADRVRMVRQLETNPFLVPPVDTTDPQEVMRAQVALSLPKDRMAALMPLVYQGAVRLAWITLWDYQQEDGDRMRIESGGLVREVGLLNTPETIAIPYIENSPITLTAIHDGGGGVTVGIRSNATELSLPPMITGQSLVLTPR